MEIQLKLIMPHLLTEVVILLGGENKKGIRVLRLFNLISQI
jgi:hypothetical protein